MREGANASADELILLHSARQLLTLHGSTAPRRGPDMRNLAIIPDGAVLIRNGLIEEVGPTRRVANLVRAKRAREVDATGRIVLPAFVDPDAPLVTHALSAGQKARIEKGSAGENGSNAEFPPVVSKRRMEMRSAAMAHALASYGVLTTGSSTGSVDDPKNVSRILAVHKTLEGAPLRIRSVLGWPARGMRGHAREERELGDWLNTIRARELASVVEFVAGDRDAEGLRRVAQLSMQHGFAVRLRSRGEIDRETVELALGCGAIALHWSPVSAHSLPGELASNCVLVAPGSELVEYDSHDGHAVRSAVDSGLALALSSAFRTGATGSLNMQFILHLACSRLKLTPEEAITASTHNAAAALRLADSAGSLAPGRQADLIMMDVPDYRDLITRAGHHDVVSVIRAGRIIYRRPSLTLE